MNALYHLGIIEGVALAHGKDTFPEKFWAAIEYLAVEYVAVSISEERIEQQLQIKIPVEEMLQQVLGDACKKGELFIVPPIAHEDLPAQEQKITDRDDSSINQDETTEILPIGKKERKPWSDEAKQRMRERTQARIDAGTFTPGKRKSSEQGPKDSASDSPPPPTGYGRAFSAPIRTTNATQTDVTLTDDDWADIKRMRKNGLPDLRIASSLDVDLEYLERFSDRMTAQDKASAPGNA